MNPKAAMMEGGRAKPMGVGDLMGEDFQNRDKSLYQPMVEADVSNLMSEDFQNRDRSALAGLLDANKPKANTYGQSRK